MIHKRKRAQTSSREIQLGFGKYYITYDSEDGVLYSVTDQDDNLDIDDQDLIQEIQHHVYAHFDDWQIEDDLDRRMDAAENRINEF